MSQLTYLHNPIVNTRTYNSLPPLNLTYIHIYAQQDGLKAVLRLGSGDMRKVLNLLQSAAMAHPDQVSEKEVYDCAGKPTPQEIRTCADALLNQSFVEGVQCVRSLQVRYVYDSWKYTYV